MLIMGSFSIIPRCRRIPRLLPIHCPIYIRRSTHTGCTLLNRKGCSRPQTYVLFIPLQQRPFISILHTLRQYLKQIFPRVHPSLSQRQRLSIFTCLPTYLEVAAQNNPPSDNSLQPKKVMHMTQNYDPRERWRRFHGRMLCICTLPRWISSLDYHL